jgi:hypothetical protein
MLCHPPRGPIRVGCVLHSTRQVELIIPDHAAQRKGGWRAEMAEQEMPAYPAPILPGKAAPSEGTSVRITCKSTS